MSPPEGQYTEADEAGAGKHSHDISRASKRFKEIAALYCMYDDDQGSIETKDDDGNRGKPDDPCLSRHEPGPTISHI